MSQERAGRESQVSNVSRIAIILAGGEGRRMSGGGLPKQFLEFNGRPILMHTLQVFDSCPSIDQIVIVSHPHHSARVRRLVATGGLAKPVAIVEGGGSRQESVWNALDYLRSISPGVVVIHDSVRPFVTHEIIDRSIAAAEAVGAADVVVKTTDTIVAVDQGFISSIPDRNLLYNGQTPQTFRFEIILSAHEQARMAGFVDTTDDVKLVLRLGHPVQVVEGSYENIKLTTPFDVHLAQLIYENRKVENRVHV